MSRRVFFSFHYEEDIWRTNVVRNHWITQGYGETGVIDASLWEETKKKGDSAIKRMIDDGLKNTTATVVLIGAETSDRRWVRYEILRSLRRNNAIVPIRIHTIKNQYGKASKKGRNPLSDIFVTEGEKQFRLSEICPVYDWSSDDGFHNIGQWVEQAIEQKPSLRPVGRINGAGMGLSELNDLVGSDDVHEARRLRIRRKSIDTRGGMNG